MNVKQLIKKLERYQDDARVVYYSRNAHLRHSPGYGNDIIDIETDGINVCIVGDFQ